MTFSGTQKPTPPTVFNLQASDWVHCEEETGVHAGISLHTYKLVNKITNFESYLFCPKKKLISKNSVKFIVNFFSQRDIPAYVYMC